ncbi:MAG: Fic family protein [Candidatus Pacearchaeota archaeon]
MVKEINFIRPGLLAELKQKRDIILRKVPNETGLRTRLFEAANLDAAYHSRITEPDHAERSRRIGRRRDFREAVGNLREAKRYAEDNFKGDLDDEFIFNVAKSIDPNLSRGYRRDNVRISGYDDCGANPIKIGEQMNALNKLAVDPSLDPVERAVLYHLHFLRIHPLSDGNGRTARFMQNFLLSVQGYAPAILEPAERTFYNDLIHKARRGFKEREALGDIRAPELMGIPPDPQSPESEFSHFMATKVNIGMDRLVGDYEKIAKYSIQFTGYRNPDEIKGIKSSLVRYLAHSGRPFHVGITDAKRGILELSAESSDVEIDCFLSKRTPLKYKITRTC